MKGIYVGDTGFFDGCTYGKSYELKQSETRKEAYTVLVNDDGGESNLFKSKFKVYETELTKFALDVHINAVEHGWWDDERSFGDIIALCHSELSEALEEHRDGRAPTEIYYNINSDKPDKPEGIPAELADCIIRILDYCGREGIDIDYAINLKHEYNKTRPYRHGGKTI